VGDAPPLAHQAVGIFLGCINKGLTGVSLGRVHNPVRLAECTGVKQNTKLILIAFIIRIILIEY
jgi:hypothetical protein